ncbi:integrase core domain protein [Plakobranchus ocellatus]|uniref:Integrase core domain protein n=1 Tax=Plakobranchus ocellatus TaxID=259542 RepID=A0AAV3ZP43_9GAST|nr:integrase core domain protein [Plakobranchus ocellatus]
MVFSEFNSGSQADLIDFQSHPDGEQNGVPRSSTKFVVLSALETRRAKEVAYKLVDILTFLGARKVLQFDNSREFANNVLSSVSTGQS